VWLYPAEAVCERICGQLLLLFVLQRSGQVKRVEILRSSGSQVLDKEAWDAVTNATQFDPFRRTSRRKNCTFEGDSAKSWNRLNSKRPCSSYPHAAGYDQYWYRIWVATQEALAWCATYPGGPGQLWGRDLVITTTPFHRRK
jgi:TonB family protein